MTAGGEPDAADAALRLAYEARSRQLLEARAALAESAEEVAAVTAERDALRAERDALQAQVERERTELAAVRASKLMRWSAPLRRALDRLRPARR